MGIVNSMAIIKPYFELFGSNKPSIGELEVPVKPDAIFFPFAQISTV
jgi:hypothetical protein